MLNSAFGISNSCQKPDKAKKLGNDQTERQAENKGNDQTERQAEKMTKPIPRSLRYASQA